MKFWEAPNKSLGGFQLNFGRLPKNFGRLQNFQRSHYGGSKMLKGFEILGGSQSNFGWLQNFWEAPNFFPSDLYHLLISPTNHKIAYDFLNAFVETRNLRYCEVKSEH